MCSFFDCLAQKKEKAEIIDTIIKPFEDCKKTYLSLYIEHSMFTGRGTQVLDNQKINDVATYKGMLTDFSLGFQVNNLFFVGFGGGFGQLNMSKEDKEFYAPKEDKPYIGYAEKLKASCYFLDFRKNLAQTRVTPDAGLKLGFLNNECKGLFYEISLGAKYRIKYNMSTYLKFCVNRFKDQQNYQVENESYGIVFNHYGMILGFEF